MTPEATDAAEWSEDSEAGRRLDRPDGEKMNGRHTLWDFVSCHHKDEFFSAYIGQEADQKGTIAHQSPPYP
jgi:hypothetical protein